MKQKIIVAVFKKFNSETGKSAVVGYRFYDFKKKMVEDLSVKDKKFSSFVINNKDNIENAVWDSTRMMGKSALKFVNGKEQRYPILNADTGELVGKNPLVIAAEFRDGYLIVGPFGECFEWTKEQAVTYARLNGIANGSCKSMGETGFISAISGNYAFIDRNVITPEMLAKKEALEKAKKEKLAKEAKTEEKVVDKLPVKEEPKVEDKKEIEKTELEKNLEKSLNDKFKEEENKEPVKVVDEGAGLEENEDSENKSVEQSILEEVEPEVISEGLTEEEVQEALSSVYVDEKVKNQKYDDDFYKQLEPTFGGKKSVAILKYMIENRNYPIESVYKLIEEGKEVNKYVPTLIGLLVIYTNIQCNHFDKELDSLCREAIDPEVFNLEKDLIYRGIKFEDVWDADIVAQKREHDTRKWAFPLSLLEERIANYIATTGCELYGCLIEKDGTTWYNGVEVNVPGYRISGVNPSYITITNEMGKTKKVKKNK